MFKWYYLFEDAIISRVRYLPSMIALLFSELFRLIVMIIIWYSFLESEKLDTIGKDSPTGIMG